MGKMITPAVAMEINKKAIRKSEKMHPRIDPHHPDE